jgi:hypothetical protein
MMAKHPRRSLLGLHLAGDDLAEIRTDIEPIIKDLLFHNSNVVVDTVQWVPSLEEAVRHMARSTPPLDPDKSFLMIVGHAA